MSFQNLVVFGAAATLLASAARAGDEAANWPQFRGPNAGGVSTGGKAPTAWDVPAGRNVLWKTPIAGLAHSSPIIWGDRLFAMTAVPKGLDPELKVGLYGAGDSAKDMVEHEFRLLCLDKRSGRVLWDRLAHQGVPRVKRHTKATHCNTTPATDGKRVVAFFGSEGLYCYDMDGELKWKKDLGVLNAGPYNAPELEWGFASSPIIADDKVVVQCDVYEKPFLAAFWLDDGRELWRTPREDVCTWGTPTLCRSKGRTQVVVNGWKQIGGYDLADGKPIWWMRGGGDVPVPTPVVANDLIYITNAHGGPSPIYAIFPDAAGDITPPDDAVSTRHIAWMVPRGGNYMQTLLVHDGLLYACNDQGMLSCYDAKDGERHYFRERLTTGRSGFTASGVAADGKLYFTSEDGEVFVVRPGKSLQVIATNPMDELCMATPAISEGVLYFRTRGRLVAIAESTASAAATSAPAGTAEPGR